MGGSSRGGKGGGKGGPIGFVSNALTSASDAIGLKQPLDNLGKRLTPQPPEIETPTMPDMGQTIGMAGGDTMSAGGEFDLGKDEDDEAVRSRRKKRRGRREMIGEGVGLSAGTSDVGVKI